MAKKKSRQFGAKNSRKNISSPANQSRHIAEFDNLRRLEGLVRKLEETKPLTRDNLAIANRDNRLSLAEDLRYHNPYKRHDNFRNIDGTVADTMYKPVTVKKKTLYLIAYVGSTVLLILITLLVAGVDINVVKSFSLIKFW